MNRKKTITAHMIVRNEDMWVWYSIMSVLHYVHKLIIFDTGSSDCTVDIIKTIVTDRRYGSKIVFEQKGLVDKKGFTALRQEQIEMTTTDYFLVLDGDEIWYENSVSELAGLLNAVGPKLVATRFINCAGDIHHYRDFSREAYNIKGITGSITIRAYSMSINGIHCEGNYGVEGYYDQNGITVQNNNEDILVMNGYFLHTSLLRRSSNLWGDLSIGYRRKKIFFDWDYRFSKSFNYPEVFYMARPEIVPSPWEHRIDSLRLIIHSAKVVRSWLRRLKDKLITQILLLDLM